MNIKNTTTKSEWNEISFWLQSLNYGSYAHLFKNGGYDLWEIIYDLDTNDLKDMGIKPGHAKRIKKLLNIRKVAHLSSNQEIQNIQLQRMNSINNHNTNNKSQPQEPQQPQLRIQQLQHLQNEERKLRMRDKSANVLLAGNMKNKLFDTMTRVLNGLQQQLIEYNAKFAEPINEMNQRIIRLQQIENKNENNVWDCNECLFAPMIRNIDDIKQYNESMWNKMNFFRNLAESQINSSSKQLQKQISITNQMKNEYISKQQQIYYQQPQIQTQSQPPPPSVTASNSRIANVANILTEKNKTKMIRKPAYNSGIAQKMYRMGVLSATLPKKLEALQLHRNDDKKNKMKIADKSPIITRRYSLEETNFIRKLIADYPRNDAKLLFGKFRQRFECWKDDSDSYHKFYQKKWRICKEKNKLCKKRKISFGGGSFNGNVNMDINTKEPPGKKLRGNGNNFNCLPPPLLP